MGPTERVYVSESGRVERTTVDLWGAEDQAGAHCGELVLTVEVQAPVPLVLEALIEHGAHAAVVVERGTPVGVVSLTDISRAVNEERLRVVPEGTAFDPAVDQGTLARDVMHAPIVTCRPDEGLAEVSARMSEHNVHQLPVVDEAGQVLGLLRSMDVLRAWTGPRESSA